MLPPALELEVEEMKNALGMLLTADGKPTELKEGDVLCFFRDVGTITFLRSFQEQGRGNKLFFGDQFGKDDKIFIGSILQDRKNCEALANSVASQCGFRLKRSRDTESFTAYQFVRS